MEEKNKEPKGEKVKKTEMAAAGAGVGAGARGGGVSVFSTTQYVDPLSAPAVIPDLDFENPVKPDFLTCSNRAVAHCFRRFGTSTASFSDCMYGFLVSSRLLPKGVAALADQARVDTTGAFAEGASLSCELIEPGNGYPGMVAYY